MITFQEVCQETGYDPNAVPVYQHVYYAYTNNEMVKCETYKEASKLSTIVEKALDNQEEIANFQETQNKLRDQTVALWSDQLKDEFPHLPYKVFYLCFERTMMHNNFTSPKFIEDLTDNIYFATRILHV